MQNFFNYTSVRSAGIAADQLTDTMHSVSQ